MNIRKKGFTLVELLVVIGIIMILAAILTPVLMSAKERANRVTCVNNVRQIGMQMMIWANDHDGVFPFFLDSELSGPAANAVDVYNMIVGPQFCDDKIFVCPNNGRYKPPVLDRTTPGEWIQDTDLTDICSSSGTVAGTGERVISYLPVVAYIDAGGTNEDAPNSNDAGGNVLIIENPAPGEIDTYSALDNHKADGGMAFYLNGKAAFVALPPEEGGGSDAASSRPVPNNIARDGGEYDCEEAMLYVAEDRS